MLDNAYMGHSHTHYIFHAVATAILSVTTWNRGWTMRLPTYDIKPPGPCLNIKTVLSTYSDFHVKDKTAVRTSYL